MLHFKENNSLAFQFHLYYYCPLQTINQVIYILCKIHATELLTFQAATLNRDVVAFIVTFSLQIHSLFWHVKEIFIKIAPNRENRHMKEWLAHTI